MYIQNDITPYRTMFPRNYMWCGTMNPTIQFVWQLRLKSVANSDGSPYYTVHSKILDAKYHGLPQSRKRLFMVALATRKMKKTLQMAFAKALGAFAFCDLPEKGWWWENLGRNQNNVGLWYHYHYHLTYLWGYSCRKWMKSDVQLCNLDCIRIAPRRCVRGGQMGRGTCSTPLQGPSDQP